MENKRQTIQLNQFVRHQKGFAFKSTDYVSSGIPVVRVSNFTDDSIDTADFKYVTSTIADDKAIFELMENDVVIATVGSWPKNPASVVGKVIRVPPEATPSLLNQNAVILKPISNERYDKDYLYYILKNKNFSDYIVSTAQGSANQASITLKDIYAYSFSLPRPEERKAISQMLRKLDNKITLNRQINQTLEQMAQALFKSWFVDFDPVVDNALDAGFFEQGLQFSDELLHRAEARKAVRESADFKPLPEDIRQLFPVAFEECSEPSLSLGRWVPKGWKPSNVGFEFDVTMGQSPPGSTYNEIGSGLPFFQGKTDFGFRFPSNRIYCTEPKRMAKKDDTLISVRAPVGDINLAAEDCAIGRGLAAARHKSGSISFSYYVMNSLSKYFEVFEGEGTVFGSINQKDFKALPLIKYPGEIITKFDEFCGNWDKRINNLSVEISTLTDLRDTLLPKLISGELRLSDSEVDTADEVLA